MPIKTKKFASLGLTMAMLALPWQASQADTIRIGHMAPLSGNFSKQGKENENGARLAIEELNARHLIIGGEEAVFELITEDDGGNPDIAIGAAKRLLAKGVKGVVGGLNSATTIATAPLFHAAGIPQVSPSATNPRYTELGFNTTFRLIASDKMVASIMATVMTQRHDAKKIAVISDGSAYGNTQVDSFSRSVDINRAIIVKDILLPRDQRERQVQLQELSDKHPDLVFYGGMDTEAGPLFKQLIELGVTAKFAGGDGICSYDLPRLAQYSFKDNQVYCAEPGGMDGKTYEEFDKRFKERFGVNVRLYAPLSYEAVMVLAKAMQKADSPEPRIYSLLMPLLEYDGILGPISFDSKGDLRRATITVNTYRDNQHVVVSRSRQ